MVSNLHDGKVVHRSVNACLAPLYSIQGMHVVTVEGEIPSTYRPRLWAVSGIA